MRSKKIFALSAFGMALACATAVVAQDDLDSLLDSLEGGKKKAPAAQTKPAGEAAAPAAEPAAPAAPAAPAVVEAPAAPAAPAVVEAPAAPAAPAIVEAPAAPAAPAVVEAPAAPAAPAVAEEKPAVPAKPAAKPQGASDAQIENFLADLAAKPNSTAPQAQDGKAPAAAAVPAEPEDPADIAELASMERVRRTALNAQAQSELLGARAAMKEKDWDEASRLYRLAFTHLNDQAASREFKKECAQGIAEAEYQGGKKALSEGNRALAKDYAEKALKFRHPRAQALIDALSVDANAEAPVDNTLVEHRRNKKDYKESRDDFRRLLRRSAEYLAVADLDKALEQCDLVLRQDPYNGEAIRLRERIQRRRNNITQSEREATRRGMIADVNAAWRPVYAISAPELAEVDGGTSKNAASGDSTRSVEQSIEESMKQMTLPAIQFRPPATIIDAVDFFRQASKDYDRPDKPADQRGFNFVLQLDKTLTGGGEEKPAEGGNDNAFNAGDEGGDAAAAGNVPVIPNISASNVSMWEALKLVCQVCKPAFKFKVQGSVVMVMPADMTTDEMLVRSYNVTENFAERMSSASGDVKEAGGGFGNKKGDEEESADGNTEQEWKTFFEEMGVTWPKGSRIKYIKTIGKLRVTNTAEQLATLEQALDLLNVTPFMVEIETRFVEVAQEDLNSLGFEWLLNSDYSLNFGGKLSKALGIKSGTWDPTGIAGGYTQDSGTRTVSSTSTANYDAGTGGVFGNGQATRLWDTLTGPDSTTTETYTWKQGTTSGNNWTRVGSGGHRNVGINAINGTDYSTGMRYLSSENSSITKADGTLYSDQFMRVNAFLGNADLSMILHMLSQRSDTDLLSAPKVVTKNGVAATIKEVTKFRFPQDYDVTIQSTSSSSSGSSVGGSSGGSDGKILPMVEPQNFETEEVGVILEVEPNVSPENQMINLKLHPRVVSEPTWKDYGMKVPMASVMPSTAYNPLLGGSTEMEWFNVPMEQPFFKYRDIETEVSIYNGATVVMGGLITEERKSMEDKIPFLGDIPWVGRFFRSRSEWSNKRNLLVFVTARLVDPRGRPMSTGNEAADAKQDAPTTPAPADK